MHNQSASRFNLRRWLANRTLRRVVQTAVTLAAFGYLYSIVDTGGLAHAFASVSLTAWFLAVLLTCLSLTCGVVRWWLLFRTFGAVRPPGLRTLTKHYLIGLFYNTFLPGGVSGDIVRGLASQNAWEPGSTGGFATVLVERALGLSALLGLTATATLAHPLPGTHGLWLPAVSAFAAVMGITLALAASNRLGAFAPAVVRGFLQRLPAPTSWWPLGAALLLSLVTQLSPALSGYVLIRSLTPNVTLLDALVIVPLASAAAYLPVTVSGAGVREALFVRLFALVGVASQAALVGSLSMWLTQASIAAIGGVYVLFTRDPFRASSA